MLGRASTGVRKANAAHHDKGGEGALLTQSMADINACSREPLYKEYDAVVRGTTVIPRGTADAGVIVPLPGAKFGVALSVGRSVREAVRKIVAVGARPIGLTDCLNFGNPNNEEHYAQLVSAVDTLSEEAKNLGLPFVSGNVSLYNESSSGTAIPSSPIIGCVGVVDDVSKVVTPALKHPGSPLYFIEDKRVAAVLEAIEGRLILSARAIGGDGVLAAAAQMAFASGNDFGVEFETDITSQTFDGGWLVEAAETAAFEDWQRLGITTVADIEGEVDITSGGESWDLDELRAAWVEPLGEIYA
jgi:phosphoribosylformylglycinamidine (FGAM) synthase-like enzyme